MNENGGGPAAAFANWKTPWGAPFIYSGWNWYHAGTVAFWVMHFKLTKTPFDARIDGFIFAFLFLLFECLLFSLISAGDFIRPKPQSLYSSPLDSHFSHCQVL